MSCHSQKNLETETTNLILSILMSHSGGLSETEFYIECRLNFGIDFDERLTHFNMDNIEEYINNFYIIDPYTLNKNENRPCRHIIANMVKCFKTDNDTRKLYPIGKFFYKLKPSEEWSSKYHKVNFKKIVDLTCNKKEADYPRNYRDVIRGNQFKYDVKNDRILDRIPIQGNYDSELPQPDFTPFNLRINVRELFSDPKVLRNCPMNLEAFCKIYKSKYKKPIQYHSQSTIYQDYQILLSLGKDISFNKIYKYDEDYEKFVKFITVEPGNFIQNNILLKNLHEHLEILKNVDYIDNQSFLSFDELMVLTFKRLYKLMNLNKNCISLKFGSIKVKKWNGQDIFGRVGISSEEIYDYYFKVFCERIQFSLLGFKSYRELLKVVLSGICVYDGEKYFLKIFK